MSLCQPVLEKFNLWVFLDMKRSLTIPKQAGNSTKELYSLQRNGRPLSTCTCAHITFQVPVWKHRSNQLTSLLPLRSDHSCHLGYLNVQGQIQDLLVGSLPPYQPHYLLLPQGTEDAMPIPRWLKHAACTPATRHPGVKSWTSALSLSSFRFPLAPTSASWTFPED